MLAPITEKETSWTGLNNSKSCNNYTSKAR